MEALQMTWGWQPALYLFLGGMGAGTFLAAGILYLKDRTANRRVIGASAWAALVCLGVGLLLLLSELTSPLRGLLMWQSFSNATSWMMFGAWAAFAAMIVYFAIAVLMMKRAQAAMETRWPNSQGRVAKVGRILVIVGMALSAFVAVYTGMLLMSAPGVPLWNTVLLPCLFTVSALDTGVALVEVIAVALSKKEALAHDAVVFLEKAVVVLVALEAVVLAAYVLTSLLGDASMPVSATASASMQVLVAGVLAPGFWGLLVVCGLALPFAIALHALVKKTTQLNRLMVFGAAGAMLGGCALRFLILMAGQHADLVAGTLSLLAL